MTRRNDTFVGLDLDGSRVRCVVAVEDDQRLCLVGSGSAPPGRWDEIAGRGPHLTSDAVDQAVSRAETESGLDICSALVGISGGVRSHLVKIPVPVSSKRGVVKIADITNAFNAVSEEWCGPESTVLQLVPLDFVVGSGPPMLDPIGQRAGHLEARVLVISIRTEEHESAVRRVNEASIVVEETVWGGFAAMCGALNAVDHENGAVHLGIGRTDSSLVAVAGGRLRLATSLPLGEDDVVRDVVETFATTPAIAEAIISEVGRADPASARTRSSANVYVNVPTNGRRYGRGPSVPLPGWGLDWVIGCRIAGCLVLARDELRLAGLANGEVRSLVISGRWAALPGFVEMAQHITGLKTRVGGPMHLAGVPEALETPDWACAAGLVAHACRIADRPKGIGRARLLFRRARNRENAA